MYDLAGLVFDGLNQLLRGVHTDVRADAQQARSVVVDLRERDFHLDDAVLLGRDPAEEGRELEALPPRSVTRALTQSRSLNASRAVFIQSRTESSCGGSKPSTFSAERKRSALIGTFVPLLWSKQAQYQYPCEAYRPYGKITRSVIPDLIES